MEEILSAYEKAHPYATKTKMELEIARVENMSPKSEKFFGNKGPKLEKLKRKLKAINAYNRFEKRSKSRIGQMPTQEEREDFKRRMELKERSRRLFESYFK